MKKFILILFSITLLIAFSSCETDSSASYSFSDLSITSVSFFDYGSSVLNFDNYDSSTEFIDFYIYSETDSNPPASGDYQLVSSTDPESGQAYLEYGILSGSENYIVVSTGGVLTVNGSTVSFTDASFTVLCVDAETKTIKSYETKTDSGSFTITQDA